jgi:hypothetical protein
MKAGRFSLAALCAFTLTGAALVPDQARPPISDWSNIETVIVSAKSSGPALWHVVRGNSEVWILGLVLPVPSDLQWNTAEVSTLLKGAHALLLPPRGQVGLFEGAWFLLTGMGTIEQPDGTTLEASLPEPLRTRFVAARTRVHKDADRYEKFLPAVAALMLESDFWRANDLSIDKAQKTVEALASRAAVPSHTIAFYPAMDVVHDVPKMSAAANRACLEYALGDIDIQSAHAVAAAQAWAVGDLAGVEANYSEIKLDACLQQNNAYAVMREKAIGDTANAITAALGRPGKTFVVIPMGTWLRKGGVLERLKAAGLAITGPGG